MNEGYIVSKDVDELIIGYLDLPSIWAFSEVNTYYLGLLSEKRDLIKRVLGSTHPASKMFDYICSLGHLWLAKGYYEMARALERSPTYRMLLGESRKDIINIDSAFSKVCGTGDRSIAEWLLELGVKSGRNVDIHIDNEYGFRIVCEKGNLDFAKWLIALGEGEYGRIDIHINTTKSGRYGLDNSAFVSACRAGHIDIVKWLVALGEESYGKINIHSGKEEPFTQACLGMHKDIAEWLLTLGKESYGKIDSSHTFFFACKNGGKYIAKMLIALGEDSHGPYKYRER